LIIAQRGGGQFPFHLLYDTLGTIFTVEGYCRMFIINGFLRFIPYSFVGWAYETALFTVVLSHWTNRGFLHAPLCPIYGTAAVAAIAILYGRVKNIALLFFTGAFLAMVLEYITSVVLELLFDARWWDYSSRSFNIHGRVCLLGAVVFGTMVVVLIRFIHPQVEKLTLRIPNKAKIIIAIVIAGGIVFDFIITASNLV